MGELREFYYLDSKLSGDYLTQIEDGLTQYKYENRVDGKPNHTFEISSGQLGEILSSTIGIPLPDFSYRRGGKNEMVKVEEFKTLNEISQFSRLVRYLEPAMIDLNATRDREFWSQLSENQFIKFDCELKVSNLYLFTNFTKGIGKQSIFNSGDDEEFNEYVKHSEAIEDKKSQKIIIKPDFSPDKNKYYFVSEIKKRFLEEDTELKDLDTERVTVIGKIDKKIDVSEKEIVFDLTETGILEVMRSKEIKQFIKQFNKDADNPITAKFYATEQDIYATKPAMKFKPLALYKT
ncbi:DUF6414 family protein [Virgibacillus siamensis]|uniref:DUF6414 family protein n=1 Tax=Virgibacillus siamensis TaxID=480071 RepID=UPI00098651B9|nr:hypothetical protein [Virgibacillus siamensis]